jgi:hypothetical protein
MQRIDDNLERIIYFSLISLRMEKVFTKDGDRLQLGPLVADVMAQFHLSNTKLVLLSMDPNVEEMLEGESGQQQSLIGLLQQNVLPLANANRALNRILAEILAECSDSTKNDEIIDLCRRVIAAITTSDRISGRFPQADILDRQLNLHRAKKIEDEQYLFTDFLNGVILFVLISDHLNVYPVLMIRSIQQ